MRSRTFRLSAKIHFPIFHITSTRILLVFAISILLSSTSSWWLVSETAREVGSEIPIMDSNLLLLSNHFQPSVTEPVIDFMSIGTLNRPINHIVQQRTMGSHPLVRNFNLMNEDDDEDRECNSQMTNETVWKVSTFCKSSNKHLPKGEYRELRKMTRNYASTRWLKKKSNPKGWMCAVSYTHLTLPTTPYV